MRPFVLLPLCLIAVATPLAAQQRHDSDAPITVGADSAELQDKQHRSILTGHVVIQQGEMTLNAARVTLLLSGQVTDGSPEIVRADAAGSVVVRRPGQTARSQYAIYDTKRRVITMIGAVTLTQGGNTVSGGRLTINLDTSRAVMDGSSVAGTPAPGGKGDTGGVVSQGGGRVTGTFSVPKRN